MPALCLRRTVKQEIFIGPDVKVVVTKVDRDKVSLAIVAPSGVRIMRGELLTAAAREEAERQAAL